jgi:hypothetical protein
MLMKNGLIQKAAAAWRADFLSPKDLARRALMLVIFYAILHIAGLREFVSILNGTVGSLRLGWGMSVFLGLLYIVAHLAFILLVPSMLMAAGLLSLWSRIRKRGNA